MCLKYNCFSCCHESEDDGLPPGVPVKPPPPPGVPVKPPPPPVAENPPPSPAVEKQQPTPVVPQSPPPADDKPRPPPADEKRSPPPADEKPQSDPEPRGASKVKEAVDDFHLKSDANTEKQKIGSASTQSTNSSDQHPSKILHAQTGELHAKGQGKTTESYGGDDGDEKAKKKPEKKSIRSDRASKLSSGE